MLFLITVAVLTISMRIDRSRYRNCYFFFMALTFGILELSLLLGRIHFSLPLLLFAALGIAVLAAPIVLIQNGLQMWKKEGHSLKNLLSLFAGAALGIGELCGILFVVNVLLAVRFDRDILHIAGIPARIMIFISLSALYFSVSFLVFMLYTLFLEMIPKKRDFDFVIIHGAGLLQGNRVSKLLSDRLDKAIEVFHKDPTPPILIPSGGKGGDETVAEADAMAEYLLAHGIPEDHIIRENQSRTTRENLIYSGKIITELDDGLANDYKPYIALVTSNYHVYRALRYCRQVGIKCTGIGSHVARYYWPSALIREYIAIHAEAKHLVMLVLGWIVTSGLPLFVLMMAG